VGLGFWQRAAVACRGSIVGTGVQRDFPLTFDLLPEGNVTAAEGNRLSVGVFGGGGVVSPGEAGVAGRTHLRALGVPGELVVFGVPVGAAGDGGSAELGWLAVAEGDGVVGEPGDEGLASALGYVVAEAALQLDQFDLSRGKSWCGEGVNLWLLGGFLRIEGLSRERDRRDGEHAGADKEKKRWDAFHDGIVLRPRSGQDDFAGAYGVESRRGIDFGVVSGTVRVPARRSNAAFA